MSTETINCCMVQAEGLSLGKSVLRLKMSQGGMYTYILP